MSKINGWFTSLASGLLLVNLLFPFISQASYEEYQKAPGIRQAGLYVKVHKDGTATVTAKDTVTIQHEKGVTKYGVSVDYYEPGRERFQIVKMETRNGNVVTAILPENIEDKPLASDTTGFDEMRQVTGVFPAVRMGSTLYRESRLEIFRPAIPGVFGTNLRYSSDTALEKDETTIESELPLYWKVHDPWGLLLVQHEIRGSLNVLHIQLRKPVYFKIVDEVNTVQMAEDKPRVVVSTLQDWGELGRRVSELWEAKLNVELPELLERMASDLRKLPTEQAKLDALVALISDRLRYHGDWRPVDGADVPNRLSDISERGYGDCKDHTAVVVAVLRKIGMEAYPAFVDRENHPPTVSYELPVLDNFNHAIAYVRMADGRVLWLDATNTYRPSTVIPRDIAGRPALVLAGERSRLFEIPSEDPKHHGIDERIDLKPMQNGWTAGSLVRKYRGNHAFDANRSIVVNKKSLAAEVRAELKSMGSELRDFKMLTPEPSTLSAPFGLEAHFTWEAKDVLYKSGAYDFYVIPVPSLVRVLGRVDSSRRRSSFEGKAVGTFTTEYRLDGWKILGVPPADCSVDTPWFMIRREIHAVERALSIRDTVLTKRRVIPVSGIRSEEFAQAVKGLRSCFLQVGVVLERM